MVSYEGLTTEQQRAVNALDRNVTLTAGAGTGKTTTLTARYLRMIERSIAETDGDDEILLPENILTTTFTERAANELEESIRGEITDRIDELPPAEFDAWRTVADELDQGYIHTLHGFCARLLREHALTADAVDPGFETIDEDETRALVHNTVGAVLEDHETHEAVQTLSRQYDRSQLREILTDLLGERPESIQWAKDWVDETEEAYLSYVEQHLHPIDPDEAAERLSHPDFIAAVETIERIVTDPPDIETGGSVWKRAVGVIDILDGGFDDGAGTRAKQTMLAEVSRHLTTSGGDRYAGYTGAKTRWNDHPQKEEFDAAFETLVDLLEPEHHAVDVDPDVEAASFSFVQALAELTLLVADEYEERKTRQNVVDFTDLITYTLDFLDREEHRYVRQQLRDQFEYVMVDEFQDTDPRQWDLIKLLTSGAGDSFDAHNVFVVGDVKQSIYRFRNADVTQFKETEQTLTQTTRGGQETDDDTDAEEDEQLSTNFRSLPAVLKPINTLFEEIFEDGGDAYEAEPQSLTPNRSDPTELGSVEYLTVPTNAAYRADRFDHYEAFAEEEREHDTELEAMALAARLSQVLSEPYQVYPTEDEEEEEDGAGAADDDEPPEPREIEPSDIAILIRSRTHLKAYERALEDAEVPYSVASGLGFYGSAEITALLNLFRALADPDDERALYATLRSPLFGLTDDTLARLKRHDKPLWEALGAAEATDLATVYDQLIEWRAMAGLSDSATDWDGSWAAFLTQIIEDTGFLASVSADERPQQARANIEKFREQLRGLSDEGVRSLTMLVDRLERRIDLGGRESEAETTDEGVQILTIHDAKGMEFPFVVVPGITRGFNDEAALGNGSVEFERIGDDQAIGLKAPNPEEPFEFTDTIVRETIREQRRHEERAEEKRVLYVACTRARDHLLLSGTHEHDTDDEEEPTSLTGLAEADPGDPSSWGDWVQPALLSEDVCRRLDDNERVELAFGEETVTISVPTAPATVGAAEAPDRPTLELMPAPPTPERTFQLSATDLASLLGGYSRLTVDQETNTAFAETIEESPDDRHGEPDPSDRDQQQDETSGETDTDRPADPLVFGEMVHRLCELRPPSDQWPSLIEQTLVDQDADRDLTPDLQRRVNTHAKRGIAFVDSCAEDVTVQQQYDELYVTAEFERGEISGYIDHLIVTPEGYHIIDYKTGSVTPEEMDEDAAYYANQMKAYAVALAQQDSSRSVQVSLFFTELDEAWEANWEHHEVETIEESIKTELQARLE